MPAKPVLLASEKDLARIMRAYEQGETLKNIGRRLGASAVTVAARLRKAGVLPERGRCLVNRRARRRREEMVCMYLMGIPAAHIAREYQIGRRFVYDILHEAGVRLRTRRQNQDLWEQANTGRLYGSTLGEAIRLYLSGWSAAALGRKYALPSGVVYYRLETHGVKMRGKSEALKTMIRRGEKKMDGPSAPGWKGGRRRNSQGYALVWNPAHHRANAGGYVFEHIMVAERTLGRRLRAGEVVHHKNGVPDDNRPENLSVFASSAEHTSFHHKNRKVKGGDSCSRRSKHRPIRPARSRGRRRN